MAYGVGSKTLRLLRAYWEQLTIVSKDGGYFRRPFKYYQGVTQFNTLSPTIFNMVLDDIIRHWVTVMTPIEAGTVGLGLKIIDLAEYFYVDDGLIPSTQPDMLKSDFDVLASLFGRVGLQKNTTNTVGMVCQHCHAPGAMSEEAYKIRTTGKLTTFQEHQWSRVE